MTSDTQLGRSVLESKERTELQAIAEQLSVKTTSRMKKADLIAEILTAAGVGADAPASVETSPAPSGATSGRPARAKAPETPAEEPREGASVTEATAESGAVATATVTETTSEEPRTERPPRQGGQGNQGGQRQGGQSNQSNQSSQNAEPGNRRNRRNRRGRERGERGERDLQSGADAPYQGDLIECRGLLDLRDEGYGFLRSEGYLPSNKDVYVSISQARKFALRKGDAIEGAFRPAGSNEKYPALIRIDTIAGMDPEKARERRRFEDLTPLFPDEKLTLEQPGTSENLTARIVDLISPIGKGQRGLIVSPPKAGKTTVMKQIAHSIEANNPDVHLMVLLVDERPEEVTDMRRSVQGEVIASTFDRPSDEHTHVAELAIERAKRLVELGKDVVIILDGITRLARAYNISAPASGRIMSGGVDSAALYPPKKFFGAARNIEEGGSLTILATALVETGSKMDEVIFEEFKGTGNMELRLDRRLAERRLYPSIDVNASSTRHEELLFERGQLQQVWKLRRVLNALASEGTGAAGLELLMDKIKTTESNDEFLAEIAKGQPGG
jgi:transcription termination factor Rho